MDALNEAVKAESQQYYKTAQKNLTNIQNILRPFLTGAQDFTVEDLDNISKLLNDQSIQNVLGKNDKKALKAIQNANGMIKSKKAALAQQPADPNKAQNPSEEDPSKVDPNKAQEAVANETAVDNTTEQGNSGEGDSSKVSNNKPIIAAINRGLQSGLSVDDLIAYLQTLKK